jgi:hypothetical protein
MRKTVHFERLLRKERAAEVLDLEVSTLDDARWRQRVGLPIVKIGKSLRFRQSDLEALIERGVQKTPVAGC